MSGEKWRVVGLSDGDDVHAYQVVSPAMSEADARACVEARNASMTDSPTPAAEARVAELKAYLKEVVTFYRKLDHDLAEHFEPIAISAVRLLTPDGSDTGKTRGS